MEKIKYYSGIRRYITSRIRNPDDAEEPLQKEFNGYYKDIIKILCKKDIKGRCKAGSYILDMSGDARKNFNKTLSEALHKQSQKKRILPLSFVGDVKITIFCHSKDITIPSWEWMRNYTFARMQIANDEIRMILHVHFNEENKIVDVGFEFLDIKKVPSDQVDYIEYEVQRIRSESISKILAEKGRIRRNDMCPCGSGKKYKKCCMRNIEL